jgi:hypothetical protein
MARPAKATCLAPYFAVMPATSGGGGTYFFPADVARGVPIGAAERHDSWCAAQFRSEGLQQSGGIMECIKTEIGFSKMEIKQRANFTSLLR